MNAQNRCTADIAGDELRSACEYLTAAQAGDREAQFNLSELYKRGDVVSQDLSLSNLWCQKSADQKYADAEFEIGNALYTGMVIMSDANAKNAVDWWESAANQHHLKARYNLGCLYHTGEMVEKNISKALSWYLKAARSGHVDAQVALGKMYMDADGVDYDYNQSQSWLTDASTQGSIEAKRCLDKLDEIQRNKNN